MKKIVLCIIIAISTFILTACTSTKIRDSWQAENFSRKDLDNALIVAVTTNQTNRFLFENEMVRTMEKSGINAIASHIVLGDKLPEKEEVEAYVKTHDIDYIMATKLETVDVEKDYVPPSVRTYYTGPYYPSYGHYYGGYGMYGYGSTVTMTREAYTDTRITTILVTTVFDAKSGEPAWIGKSSTFEPGSVSSLAADLAKSTWNNMSN